MGDFIKKLYSTFKTASKPIGRFFMSALTWLCAFALTGVTSFSYGVLLLFGEGHAFITIGAFLLLFTSLIARGAANG